MKMVCVTAGPSSSCTSEQEPEQNAGFARPFAEVSTADIAHKSFKVTGLSFWKLPLQLAFLLGLLPAVLAAQSESPKEPSLFLPAVAIPDRAEQEHKDMPPSKNQPASSSEEAPMDAYFTAINYPIPKDMLMVMLLPDFQTARSGANFFTAMEMAQYGITSRWSAGFMVEEQKIFGLPTTFGGLRFNTYFRLFPHDHLLNFTLYGEYEHLNQAALYKMEVAGFGGEDLVGPLSVARHSPAHTFEQRAIVYHDWRRVNITFNFISETGLESHENDFGYAWGIFRQPEWTGMSRATDMAGMPCMAGRPGPPFLSRRRLGFGLEMIGALGNNHQFGFYWQRQQHYLGPVFSYALSPRWTFRVQPTFGLSDVSDPFVLRMGLVYSVDNFVHRLAHAF